MSMFYTINSKARGLSGSLTDYHESKLIEDVENIAPHLFISRRLNEDKNSPWYQMIRYGGENTSGIKRRTSLRMMQQSVRRLLKKTEAYICGSFEDKYQIVVDYWRAVGRVFPEEWGSPRFHLISKGLGLYSLMLLLGDIIARSKQNDFCEDFFIMKLMPLKNKIDWRTDGMFGDFGGQKGAVEVYEKLKDILQS